MFNFLRKKPNSDMDVSTLIEAYNNLKKNSPNYSEPNYALAEKVFQEFNTFNLKLSEASVMDMFVPRSLLPYPKNYIKCAYYIYIDLFEKQNNIRGIELIKTIGLGLWTGYPEFSKYKENLAQNSTLYDMQKENFKSLFGVYEISEQEYYSSPSSRENTDRELIHDFGYLPQIEEDINLDSIFNQTKEESGKKYQDDNITTTSALQEMSGEFKIEKCAGERTLKSVAHDMFRSLSENWPDDDERLIETDLPSLPTDEIEVAVYKLLGDATPLQMFKTFKSSLNPLCLTQDQIINFIESYDCSNQVTHFLFSINDKFYLVQIAGRGEQRLPSLACWDIKKDRDTVDSVPMENYIIVTPK